MDGIAAIMKLGIVPLLIAVLLRVAARKYPIKPQFRVMLFPFLATVLTMTALSFLGEWQARIFVDAAMGAIILVLPFYLIFEWVTGFGLWLYQQATERPDQ